MARSPRTPMDRYGFESSGSYIEERSKTFVVPRRTESADAASELDISSVSDIETIMSLVNNRFERKERQIKTEMREEFEKRLQRDNRHHEEVIAALKRDLTHLTKVSHECETLRERQVTLQHEINNQHEKLKSLRDENAHLKVENAKLHQLQNEMDMLKSENDALKREKALIDVKNVKLLSTVAEKEREIASLKFLIDTQYKRIKLDLTNTRDKFYNEQESLQKDMRQQHFMLSEISQAVKTLTGGDKKKDKVAVGRGERSTGAKVKPFVGGKTSASSSFNKLTLDETSKTAGSVTKKKR